jgi:DNA repair exonuclease SbcCD ATPase subunit
MFDEDMQKLIRQLERSVKGVREHSAKLNEACNKCFGKNCPTYIFHFIVQELQYNEAEFEQAKKEFDILNLERNMVGETRTPMNMQCLRTCAELEYERNRKMENLCQARQQGIERQEELNRINSELRSKRMKLALIPKQYVGLSEELATKIEQAQECLEKVRQQLTKNDKGRELKKCQQVLTELYAEFENLWHSIISTPSENLERNIRLGEERERHIQGVEQEIKRRQEEIEKLERNIAKYQNPNGDTIKEVLTTPLNDESNKSPIELIREAV